MAEHFFIDEGPIHQKAAELQGNRVNPEEIVRRVVSATGVSSGLVEFILER